MPQFALLLRNNGHTDFSADEMQHILQRYGAWSAKLRADGKIVGGNKLYDGQGRVLRKNGSGVVVTDGPFAETKEVLGGYFILDAASYDEAIELIRDCPHYDFGSLELRQVEDMRRE